MAVAKEEEEEVQLTGEESSSSLSIPQVCSLSLIEKEKEKCFEKEKVATGSRFCAFTRKK